MKLNLMLTRVAIFEGAIENGLENAFFQLPVTLNASAAIRRL
jgi:hypothetical protein